ncbi:hypothetical protein QYF61_001827, partial [Mycteria americana]
MESLEFNIGRHAAVGWNLVLSLNQYRHLKATEMINKLECLSYKEKLRELWLFSVEKRMLRGHLINMYKFLDGRDDRTRRNGHKLKYRKFHLNIRKNFFTLRMVKYQNRLPSQVMASPPLEIFKTQLNTILSKLLSNFIAASSSSKSSHSLSLSCVSLAGRDDEKGLETHSCGVTMVVERVSELPPHESEVTDVELIILLTINKKLNIQLKPLFRSFKFIKRRMGLDEGDQYAEVTLLPFPERRGGTAGSVLTAKCASCTCAQPGAQSTHFSVHRGEKSCAYRHACSLALRADRYSCSSTTYSGGPSARMDPTRIIESFRLEKTFKIIESNHEESDAEPGYAVTTPCQSTEAEFTRQ